LLTGFEVSDLKSQKSIYLSTPTDTISQLQVSFLKFKSSMFP